MPRYTRDFRRRVALHCLKHGFKGIRGHFGVADATARRWVRAYNEDPSMVGVLSRDGFTKDDQPATRRPIAESQKTARRAAANVTALVAWSYEQRAEALVKKLKESPDDRPTFDELRDLWKDMADYGLGKLKAIEISGPEGGPIEHDHTVTDDDAAAIRDELKSLGLVMGAALEDEVGDDGGGGE